MVSAGTRPQYGQCMYTAPVWSVHVVLLLVFVWHLSCLCGSTHRDKGSDASWKDDNEVPQEVIPLSSTCTCAVCTL